jgi:invasion protein IalB
MQGERCAKGSIMNARIASWSAGPGACTFALALSTAAAFTPALETAAFAQALVPTQPAPKAAAPKAAPKVAPKAAPRQSPAAALQQQSAGAVAESQLIWSPWVKLCPLKGPDGNAQEGCMTARDGRDGSGLSVIATALIENQSLHEKTLRVTLPLGMWLLTPVKVAVDDGQPITAPYFLCVAHGCMAEFEASAEFIGKMKKGQALIVQGLHVQLGQLQLKVPLAEFAPSNEGPPIDSAVFDERQKKLQEDLQKRAEEYRRKIESQQEQQPAPAAR